MDILIVLLNRPGFGTFQRAYHFGRVLTAKGHQVTLLALSMQERWRTREQLLDGMRLVETPDLFFGSHRSGWDPWDTLSRLRWIDGRAFDVVHAIESRPAVLVPAVWARRRAGILVRDWCDWLGAGGSVEERTNPLIRLLLRPAETLFESRLRAVGDGTTTINEFLRNKAIGYSLPPSLVRVVPNGCDTRVPIDSQARAREFTGLPDRAPIIAYLGSIYPSDAELMARAFNRVWQQNRDARLLLIGHFNRSIEAMIESPSAVYRTGHVPTARVYTYLAASDVCWLPLRDSGANRGRWPGKLNDYMTSGRAVVTADVPEVASYVLGLGIGLAAPGNPASQADALLALLGDPAMREEMGQAARAAAEGRHSWENSVAVLEDFYRHLGELNR